MTALELLAELRTLGVQLEADGERLRVVAPRLVLTPALSASIATHKQELLRFLSAQPDGDLPALRPLPRAERAPLSPGQERLRALVTRAPDSSRYNLPLAFRITGPIDPDAFSEAVATIIGRHDVLRSVIGHDETGAWTALLEPDRIPAVRVEPGPPAVTAEWIQHRIETETTAPFDLTRGPLIRVVLVTLGADDHLLMLTMHHIVADGWSFELFFDELQTAWDAALTRTAASLPPVTVQYADVAAWQHDRLTPERRQAAERFWRDRFAGTPTPLALRRPRSSDGTDLRVITHLSADLLDAGDALATAEGGTSFAVFLAAYAAYLAAVTASDDVILCTPAVGRERDELQGIIGYLNNVLPLRIHVDPAVTFRYLVRTIRHDLLRALEWQDLPFQDIAALPETQRLPLTRGMFACSSRRIRSLRLAGCTVESLPVPERSADFDLGLSIEADEATLTLRDGVLGAIPPAVFLDRWIAFLEQAITHPDAPLTDLRTRSDVPVLEGGGVRRAVRPDTTLAGAAHDGTDMVVGLTADPLELQIAVIWERLFGIRPIAPDDDFFALGGHSLLAVRMLDAIEREMGTRLPLATLAAHPTVRSLARALSSAGWEPARGSLIPMRVHGDGTPFVLLHSFEGHLFLYNELAAQIGAHHPVYGCQAVGLDGTAPPLQSVEEMATHYLPLVDEQLGDGPIVFAAMCFGVSVALEMARRRSDAGKPTHLMLIDSAWEHVVSAPSTGPRRSLATRLQSRAVHELTRVRYWLRETLRMMQSSPYARREAAIRRRTAKAWLDYTPRPFDGRVTLLRTRAVAPGASDWKVQSLDVLAPGDFQTIYVGGHHFTLLHQPHVVELADAMRAAMHRPVITR